MRIVGGKYRGKNLISPKSDKVRPTADRARESIFNILNSKLSNNWTDIDLLDVFTGSGAFGLEALSRGANSVALLDIDTSDAKKNVALFEPDKNKIALIAADVNKLKLANKKYNMVFLDAPYNKGLSEVALKNLDENAWLESNCLCIVEVEKTESLSVSSSFEVDDERIYGLAKFIFLTYVK